jgi:8-oxo-dGTP pyrophosphatase MutT (NUDIX family)
VVADAFSDHAVPIHPASTVLLLADRPELEVLMVKRTTRVAFAPAAWVFPGGRVDGEDFDSRLWEACASISDREASRRLGLAEGGLAWWVAVIREALEEATVLLGDPGTADVDEMAERLRADPSSFADLVERHRLRFDCSLIHEVARFVTPLGPPRRFDARFFVARMPERQNPLHDEGEVVATTWIRPGDALEQHTTGDFAMISPQVRMLESLAEFKSVEHVLQVASEERPYRKVRVLDPHGRYRVLLPGDEGYDGADPDVEKGLVRLWLE